MIVEKIPIVSKKTRIIEIIISAICFLLFACMAIVTFGYDNNNSNTGLGIFLSAISLISIGDMLLSLTLHKNIAYSIIKKFFKRSKDNSFHLTQNQNGMLTYFFNNISNASSPIFIVGERGLGKSTAILRLIEELYLGEAGNIEDKLNGVIFINCATSKKDIFNMFSTLNPFETVEKFSHKIIIMDDAEKIGTFFISKNKELIELKNGLFVLIFNSHLYHVNELTKEFNITAPFEFKISKGIPSNIKVSEDLISNINPRILAALFILSDIYTLIDTWLVENLVHIPYNQIKKEIKTICKCGLFLQFKPNMRYIYCCQNTSNQKKIINPFIFDDVLKNAIEAPQIDKLTKWNCLLNCSMSKLRSTKQEIIHSIFNDAVKVGDYDVMYDLLDNQPYEKKEFFMYEKSLLAFHLGKHDEALQGYKSVLENACDENNRKKLMLGIIEASHGTIDTQVSSLIDDCLNELLNYEDLYHEYALYWKLHIKTERGDFKDYINPENKRFNSSCFQSIIQKLENFSNDLVCGEIIQRCYTDCIRCFHILGYNPPSLIMSNFNEFLSTELKKSQYYVNLYINANTIHYITIPQMFFDGNNDKLEECVQNAIDYYNVALHCGYGDVKSTMAAQLKKDDLLLFYQDIDFNAIRNDIINFQDLAIAQNVDVFVAYSYTLLMKWAILNPENLNNLQGLVFDENTRKEIESAYESAKSIYQKYDNCYGVLRLDFLKCLYTLITNHNRSETINNMEEILWNFHHFKRELSILEYLKNGTEKLTVNKIFTLIRIYPIILQ